LAGRLLVVGACAVLLAACGNEGGGDGDDSADAATSSSSGGVQDAGTTESDVQTGEPDTGGAEDAAGRLNEIAQSVKENGLFSQLTGVGGNPNTVFHACWNSGTTSYIAGTNGTVVGTEGLSWKTLSESTFPTLNGIASSKGGKYVHAAGLQGTVIQAKGKTGALAENWGPPGGCASNADCNDKDGCTTDFCDTGVCKHVSSKAQGCCGSIPLSDAFDNLGNWTITDIFAGQTNKGGMVWQAASVQSVTGSDRWTSPKKALYFGVADKPCVADPSKICPTYDNGKVVGSSALSTPLALPKAEKITLTFQLLMDVRDNYPDDLRVYVVQGTAKTTVWYKSKHASNKGTTGGKFSLQTIDLTKYQGKTIQLELRFDAKYYGKGQMGGEGVYIDDLLLTTKCAAGSVGSKGLSDATFFDVWAASDDAAWAVGTGGTIARWDGEEWKLETGGPIRDIRAFGGVPGQAQFLVGDKGLIASFGPGGMAPIEKSPVSTNLRSVAVTGGKDADKIHALAVGDAGTVVEYKKQKWAKAQFPIPITLTTVSADGKGGYLAAGGSMVYTRNSTGIWKQVPGNLPGSIFASAHLLGGKYLVVGSTGKNAEVTSSALTLKPDIGSINLRALWALGTKDVWVAGDQATVANFNGLTWVPKQSPYTQHLHGLWAADASNVVVAGLNGRLATFDGANWTAHDALQGIDLYAVWGTDPNDVYVAGKGGILARYDGVAWKVIAGPVVGNLRAVWGSSATDIWAVGEKARIYHSSGDGSWGPVPIEPYQPDIKQDPKKIEQDLYAIWGSGKDDIWAIGAPDKHGEATLLHYGGKTWAFLPALGTESRLFRAIWGWHKGSVLFAGTQGMVYHYNGSEFRELKSGSITTFFDVCSYGKDAMLVGGIGTVIRYIPPASFRTPPDDGEGE